MKEQTSNEITNERLSRYARYLKGKYDRCKFDFSERGPMAFRFTGLLGSLRASYCWLFPEIKEHEGVEEELKLCPKLIPLCVGIDEKNPLTREESLRFHADHLSEESWRSWESSFNRQNYIVEPLDRRISKIRAYFHRTFPQLGTYKGVRQKELEGRAAVVRARDLDDQKKSARHLTISAGLSFR